MGREERSGRCSKCNNPIIWLADVTPGGDKDTEQETVYCNKCENEYTIYYQGMLVNVEGASTSTITADEMIADDKAKQTQDDEDREYQKATAEKERLQTELDKKLKEFMH